MKGYSYTETAQMLSSLFSIEKDHISYQNDGIVITNTIFHSSALQKVPDLLSKTDKLIRENQDFKYIIFSPAGKKRFSKAILMLHGLNERSWNKYLAWASFLCTTLQRPVILFPMAFHMNRSSPEWLEKKSCFRHFLQRVNCSGPQINGSFANTFLSERLETEPLKFFSSGLQTYMDIVDLVNQLRSGEQDIFDSDVVFDIFGYSIGAFLGQILEMSDPEHLFIKSRLFLFCGGAVLNRMDSNKKTILDSKAARALIGLGKKVLGRNGKSNESWSRMASMAGEKEVLYFKSMLNEENYAAERISRLSVLHDRIKAIGLSRDKVVPASAVISVLGNAAVEMDFPYQYTHENPFPVENCEHALVDEAFQSVFEQAAEHFH